MSETKAVAERIVERVLDWSEGKRPEQRYINHLQCIIESELESSIHALVTQDLRKRLPAVLEKVKDLWKDELADQELFDK